MRPAQRSWIHQGRVVAAMNANIWDVAETIEGLLDLERPIDPAVLADPDTDLARLAAPARPTNPTGPVSWT